MRKRLKHKKHSCPMCKPHKMGWENRWSPKEDEDLRRFERAKQQWEGRHTLKANSDNE